MRTPTFVDISLLRDCITETEKDGPLKTQSALHQAVAGLMLFRGATRITPSIVMLRIAELNIPIKTQKAKKGRGPARAKLPQQESDVVVVKPVISSLPNISSPYRAPAPVNAPAKGDYSRVPVKADYEGAPTNNGFTGIIARAKKGDKQALMAWMCATCVNFEKDEITNCRCFDCPLWQTRPFQN